MHKEHLNRYQLTKLNETIQRAKQLSSFYRKHLAATGALTGLADLTMYPFITPADVSEHALRMICGSQSEISRVVTLATSGTTGNPKRVYFTADDQELTIDFFRCGMSGLVEPGDTTLILLPYEPSGSVGDLLMRGLKRIGVAPVPYGFVREVPAAVAAMCKDQATCLVGVPVQVLAMARYWEKAENCPWRPSKVLLSTDYVPQAIVRELNRIWQCEVYEHYGMTEMGLGGGIECSAHQGYHLREADLYVEIIDPKSDRVLPDGDYGEVVFTTLTRRGMPFIRYRTGDIARILPGKCPCGSWLRRLEAVRSRKEGRVWLGKGQSLTMFELDEVLFPLAGVIDFSVEVTYDQVNQLKLVVIVLNNRILDIAEVLRAVRSLPVLKILEQAGRLLLRAAIVYSDGRLVLPPGKRKIRVSARKGVMTMSGNRQERVIYLLRHGHILSEKQERRYIGQIDIPLSAKGIEQARNLHNEFTGKAITAVFCSDLARSHATATIISAGTGKEPTVRAALREISMGEWEGKSFQEIAKAYPEAYAHRGIDMIGYRIPGAESFNECSRRVLTVFDDIVSSTTGDILIVGHAGINRLLLCHTLGMPLDNLFRIIQDYGCINMIVAEQGQYRVKLLNGKRLG